MRRKNTKKVMAVALSLAMLVSGAGSFLGNGATASAAKKATLKLNKTKASVTVGSKVTLKVTKKNVKKIKKIAWSTKSKKIATVTKKGVVTGKKVGKTTILAKVTYQATGVKKSATKTLKCTVTVKAASAATPVPVTQAPVATQAPVVSQAPTATPLPDTNVGADRVVSIVGGTTPTTTIKDNGVMHKDESFLNVVQNKMGVGINLGNTMEATQDVATKDNYENATDFEKAWGAPLTTQEYIDSIHSYGYNTLRIPVAWCSMISNDGKYTINDKMLGRVEEIANYALNNGMYVIINDHWDYGWWGQFGSDDEKVRAAAWDRYESFWTQISTRFKDYSDHLILAAANEEIGDRLNDFISPEGYSDKSNAVKGHLTEDECYTTANAINQKFVDIVRGTGGNNTYRYLLAVGYNTDIDKTCDNRYVMPTDLAENGTSRLGVDVHYYNPWDFCGDGNTGNYTDASTRTTNLYFKKMTKFTKMGYGVVIGECGVCNPKQEKVTTCLNDLFTIGKTYGLCPVMWETPGMYFDRTKCIMKYKDVAELLNSFTGANGNTTDITENTFD